MSYLDDADAEQGGVASYKAQREAAQNLAPGRDEIQAAPVDLLMMRIRPEVGEGYGTSYWARLEALAADPEVLGLLRRCSTTQDAAVVDYWWQQMRQCQIAASWEAS